MMLKKSKNTKKKKKFNVWTIRTYFKKNKIIIPKDFKSNFLRDNFIKQLEKLNLILKNLKKRQLKKKIEHLES